MANSVKIMLSAIVWLSWFTSSDTVVRQHAILVEAEAFGQLGGWIMDQQFMDQMGSPFLLSQGLGTPVKDAVAHVAFPARGTYHVWVGRIEATDGPRRWEGTRQADQGDI
jgi:hypothetical protein